MAEDVPTVLQNLASRVKGLESQPIVSEPGIPAVAVIGAGAGAGQTFFSMDNPWLWVMIVGAVSAVFVLWWFMSKKNDSSEDDDDEEVPPLQPPWPQQTTPRREYAKHYGAVPQQ